MASTEFKNYYAILGVPKTASADEIKKQFRKQALKYHPDRNQGNKAAETRFKELSEAYEILGDKDKRAQYDNFGQYWQPSASSSYRSNSAYRRSSYRSNTNANVSETDFSQYGNFEEFINELLGRFSTPETSNAGSQASNNNGSNSSNNFQDFVNSTEQTNTSNEASITLSFSEAFKGTTKRIKIASQTVEVRIPAGAKPGMRVRLPGKGPARYGRAKEDLYLDVKLIPHPFFDFEGDNLVCEVPVAPDEAVLGVSISIPTPDGTVSMKVPPGILSGQVLRLKGKGWSSPKGDRTDQLVKIAIATPARVTGLEKEYYEKIRDIRSTNPREGLREIRL